MTEVVAFDAQDGDCILIRCIGEEPFNILIDAGRRGTEQAIEAYFKTLEPTERSIDLFVVTHIDSDHLAGAIGVAESAFLSPLVKEVWFNGPQHLYGSTTDVTEMSVAEAFRFCLAIRAKGWSWNGWFDEGAVQRGASVSPVSSLSLDILSPSQKQLLRLGKHWERELRRMKNRTVKQVVEMGQGEFDVAELANAPYCRDTSVVNASSIVLLMRHGDHRILMTADCPAELLLEGVPSPVEVDVCKFPHHGSGGNFSHELAGRIKSKCWIVSANGTNSHPEPASIARMLVAAQGGAMVLFNNSHAEATLWKDPSVERRHLLVTKYRDPQSPWLTLILQDGELYVRDAAPD
ncbi:MBL fold metallo-hydrolase [Bradyrhizobium sp. ORS 375]|uniref:ComEC/Rec2 family competence protein n=1 Tax=Bradyrhizobium sp. (strain ORS 375) TaxID=566679 RepID=UPI0011127095|nr:MBL fold metallo-hydrolase [Bradyrhizobium sp. ORS 375]